MKTILAVTVILLFLLGTGCSRPGCAQKGGRLTRVTRPLSGFTHLIIRDNIDVILTPSDSFQLTVEADEALIPVIRTEQFGHQLLLRNEASCAIIRRPGEQIRIFIALPKITKIDYQGSGNVHCTDTFHLDYFTVEADEGAGNVNLLLDTRFTKALINNEVTDLVLAGRSDSCFAYTASRGTLDFRNFAVQRMEVTYASARAGYVWATETLRARVYHTGSVFYRGRPGQIHTEYRSSGRVLAY